ncbi:MAG: PEP-CTERM sorting domain-containing protein [Planctomycetes bacterium]|nr:PEP-CTERM sorting domain-containing protein [Planctomycetota bacterium]
MMIATRTRTLAFVLAIAATMLVAGSVASAAIINMNIRWSGSTTQSPLVGPAGGLGETWNNFQTSGNQSALLDSTGAPTSVGYTTNLGGPDRWGWPPNLELILDGLRNFDTSSTNSQAFTINGLTVGVQYDLWIASANLNSSQRSQGEWTMINPTASATVQTVDNTANINGTTWELGNNYVLFENVVADIFGEIAVTGHSRDDNSYDTRLPLNGFQLVEDTSVPPPESLTFLNVNIYRPDPQTGLVGPAGGLGETWNQLNTNSANGLLDSDGAVTSAGYTSTNLGGPDQWGTPSLGLIASGLRNFDTGANNSQQFVINGLTEGDLYDVWIASANVNNGQRSQGEWTMINPTTSAAVQTADNTGGINGDTWELGNNYLLFENVVVDASGEIVLDGHARRDNSFDTRLPLNGFQLTRIAAAVPEPSTFLLGCLGLLGLCVLRRRRRRS